MNINTWQKFINEANSLTEPEGRQAVTGLETSISVAIPGRVFLNAPNELPLGANRLMEDVAQDIQDVLSDNSIYGVTDVVITSFGPEVVFELKFSTNDKLDEACGTKAEYLIEDFLLSRGFASENLMREEKGRMRQHGIYRFGCLIEYEVTTGDSQRGLDDIVSDIRAIPTVTIASVVVGNEKISEKRYVAGLRIKYIPSYPGNLAQPEEAKAYILRIIKRIKNVKSVSRVTLRTDRVE